MFTPIARIIDGLFEPVEAVDNGPQAARFPAAAERTPATLAAITEQVRVRVLRWCARSGLIEPDDVGEMLASEHSGFSLDAAVRAGLERLRRRYARPPFGLERKEIDALEHCYRIREDFTCIASGKA